MNMLKHADKIANLTIEQKLALLADMSSLPQSAAEGAELRHGGITTADAVNATLGRRFPSYARLIGSWNTELVSKVMGALARRAKQDGAFLMETPIANVQSTPYSDGFSEDPYLAGTFANTSVKAVYDNGVRPCLQAPCFENDDVVFSDIEPFGRAVNDYFYKPFKIASVRENGIVKIPHSRVQDAYQEVQETWWKRIEENDYVLKECRTVQDVEANATAKNVFCLGGSYASLMERWERYQTLYAEFKKGVVSYSDLESECASGAAISPEVVDEKVDSVLDFIESSLNLQNVSGTSGEDEELFLDAAQESIVLLKNSNKILPLSGDKNIALLGALAEENVLRQAEALSSDGKIKFAGYAKGYDNSKEIDTALISEGVALAKKAGVAIVVVGFDGESSKRAKGNRSMQLPVNQIALIDALVKEKIKIVAVVGGDVYPDMSFDTGCEATLIADIQAYRSGEALWNVLLGKVSPSGKLATTCYANTEALFNQLWNYKESERNKVGVFYGYRHYVSSDIAVKYPFGYGLSYTNFAYSCYSALGGIGVTVRNRGKKAAFDVVQVYVEKKNSDIARPKRELIAFTKVYLRAGEEKRLTFKINDVDLQVWDETRKAFVVEKGIYRFNVCNASNNVCASCTLSRGSASFKEKERLSDYLQAVSNIQTENYQLEPPMEFTAKAFWHSGWLKCTILLCCLDIIYLYLNSVGWLPKSIALYIAVATITAFPLLMTVKSALTYKRELAKERVKYMENKKKQRAKYSNAELSEELPFEELFEQEFTLAPNFKQEETVREDNAQQLQITRVDEGVFDKEQTLQKTVADFSALANVHGLKIDVRTAGKLFASFASSRLIILKNADKEAANKLLNALNDYFDHSVVTQSCADAKNPELFHTQTEDGTYALTQAGTTISNLTDEERKIRVVALTDVKSDMVKDLVNPIMRYIDYPQRSSFVTIKDGRAEKSCELTENVWFAIVLERDAAVIDIPKYVLDVADVLELDLQTSIPVQAIESDEEKYSPLYYGQFKKLVDNAKRDCALDEIYWKRIDRLEEYVSDCNDYRIENKQWLRIEKFVGVYLAIAGEADEALDYAVAQHVLYGMLATVAASKKQPEEKFTHMVENVFGEGCAPCSLKTVRETGIGV